ncbi:MAG TPA: CaiB/BaiF CoA-transferase family protein [Noviherbaspirillum sp.]|nr:CaiB/BaiF CoA-transferase family protein [Noviherbaspirillum sp.]
MGALSGVRVLEFEAIGPAPFCGMMLADMGADVLLVDRPGDAREGFGRERWYDVMFRGRRSLALDLKSEAAVETVLMLAEKADVLIEGYRPGVMERLGLGPDILMARNPRLVYGRVTGWGQDGPLAQRAGHDINYLALSGVLHAIGREGGAPVPPLNLVADFGGGGMALAFGVASALLQARASGRGQVVDAAMTEGAGLLATMISGMQAAGRWNEARGTNLLDSGAPWYDCYETLDGRHMAVGAIEPKFYAQLLQGLGLAQEALPAQRDRAGWPVLRERFAAAFRGKTLDEWAQVFDDSDACVTPVLTFAEARRHPHMVARRAHGEIGAIVQPVPAPRMARTPSRVAGAPPRRGEGAREALQDWQLSPEQLARLAQLGVAA